MPIDVENLCESFDCNAWSIDSFSPISSRAHGQFSTQAAARGSEPARTELSPTWHCNSVYNFADEADLSPSHVQSSSSLYQTPLRFPRDRKMLETPYPLGTAVRKAPHTITRARSISDKQAFKLLLACADASAKKVPRASLQDNHTSGAQPAEPTHFSLAGLVSEHKRLSASLIVSAKISFVAFLF